MNCVICGTIRNCGKYLNNVFINMKRIGTLFNKYHIILSYDESNDNSLQLIDDFIKENENITLHHNKDVLFKERTENLSKARNAYLKIIREKFIDYDYFIVMDCDNVCSSPVRLSTLKYHLSHANNWDGLTFNKRIYYDTWALAVDPFYINCHWFHNYYPYQKYITTLLSKTRSTNYVDCLSSFNGFAIYKTSYFINGKYNDKTIENLKYIPKQKYDYNLKLMKYNVKRNLIVVDCEHKLFHYNAVLKNKARLKISPNILFY
jgi:Glycosyl transferase family 2